MPKPLHIAIPLLLAAIGAMANYLPRVDRIELLQPLRVFAGDARAFIQGGRQISKDQLDRFRPHCEIAVRRVSDGRDRIEPGDFQVERVQRMSEEIVRIDDHPGTPLARVSWYHVDNAPFDLYRGLHFWLRSEHDPNVLRLTCRGALASPNEAEPPTIAEIRATLRDIARLHP